MSKLQSTRNSVNSFWLSKNWRSTMLWFTSLWHWKTKSTVESRLLVSPGVSSRVYSLKECCFNFSEFESNDNKTKLSSKEIESFWSSFFYNFKLELLVFISITKHPIRCIDWKLTRNSLGKTSVCSAREATMPFVMVSE